MSAESTLLLNKKNLFAALLLSACVLIVYWPVQNYEFTNYDDYQYVKNNKNIQSGFTAKSIAYAFTDISTSNWHPVTMLSHMLDWSIYGMNAGGHHWTSVIIHIFNAVLLFLFFKTATGALWRSAFAAALFALHPINVDSVAWIAERKNLLCTFFWFAAMLFYIPYVRSPGWKRYLPVVTFFALGLMSKPMAVTLPFALLLLDYWPLNRIKTIRLCKEQGEPAAGAGRKVKISFVLLEKIPLFVLSAASIAVTVYAAHSERAINSLQRVPAGNRAANVIVSYVAYLKKLLWPVDFSVFYPFNYHIPLWQVASAALLICIITFLVCRYYRKLPYLPVGWFWYLGTLVPVIGIVHVGHQSMADRYAYIPFIGLFLIFTWGITDLLKKYASVKTLAAGALGLIAALMILAQNQLTYWQNSYTLYQNVLRFAPDHFVPYKGIAIYMFDQGRYPEAADYFRIAISYNKDDAILHNNLGAASERLGKKQEAEKEYREAIRLDPKYATSYSNLGALLLGRGKHDEALKTLREAARLDPDLAEKHYNLALFFKQKGFDHQAQFHFEVAGKAKPASTDRKQARQPHSE
ncbi:MAG: tetratricopeptide repeat protein [Deltaproteobacteria bacterium]|nr:tetratricopeptide repeat protein [Deltaproteobacteria bacterium]